MRREQKQMHFPFASVGMMALVLGFLTLSIQAEEKNATPDKIAEPPKVAVKSQPDFYPALTKREELIDSMLKRDTDANFPKVPLYETIVYFSELHTIPILLQDKYLEEVGVTREEMIDVNFKDQSLQNVLDYILEPLDLTYVVDKEMVLVTTKERAARMFKTRVYPVGDLCRSSPDGYSALEMVIRNARIGEWKPQTINQLPPGYGTTGKDPWVDTFQSKGGTISVHEPSKSLVISQTYHAHEAILKLLQDLRLAQAAQKNSADRSADRSF
ncbi:hypothetical protein [Gimesia sp.]|uniref:hypothetical protein n=1 Tax=Gimesia sp. TaxID=2024833 RepID=UPI000C455749|nr:hypothetical protein [Gimesia sp.]MAX38734.1 hypothetical protein [Gimesia sp.]HAH44282.1 hypothetical protein [Planctomycetaceae bacterium]HBL45149.1 hypothetical protein [Planctomycetaceae bacterium]|tara:strand:- start:1897 stop:2709 length:813 start_codon:yes stop_codon:yes gene_type:complete